MSSNSLSGTPFSPGVLGLFANHIVKFAVIVGGCFCSIALGMQITDAGGNGLANFLRWLCALSFVVSMLSPRTGIYLALLTCPVLDLLKRMLTLFASFDLSDVSTVLALAPVTMAGVVIGTFGTRLLHKQKLFKPGEGRLFAVLTVLSSIIVAVSVLHNTESKLTLLKTIAETCAYLPLILLVPIHFPAKEDVASLFRCLLLVFVPVALYGFWQEIFGLNTFELTYLTSGLTVMADDYTASERIFSTLNSNHSFSVTMACCTIISLLLMRLPVSSKSSALIRRLCPLLALLFALACLVSLRRTGWLVVVFSGLGAYCFRSPARTGIFYAGCLSGFLLLLFNSQVLVEKLPGWEATLQSAVPGFDQGLQLQTFNDRLYSFQGLLTEKGMWSFFGLPVSDQQQFFVHDAISQALVAYGVVGLTVFLGVLIFTLSLAHRTVWRTTDLNDRKYTSLLLSFTFANLFIGAIMQNHIGIFPVNFIFWLCVGALMNITFGKKAILEGSAYMARFTHHRSRKFSLPCARPMAVRT